MHSFRKSCLSVSIVWIALTLIFAAGFKTLFPIRYGRLTGMHSWLSASTLKYVNNWLEEGPGKLHFVNYESPASIEFSTLEERWPYLSYPTGETFFVYCFAKLAGKSEIDLPFLKRLQLGCFWMSLLFFALFVYRFLAGNGVISEIGKAVSAFFTAWLWAWTPTSAWYLSNIYFADQCEIPFVMAFLLVEYECAGGKSKAWIITLNILKAALVFAGVMIDHYFWILVFVAFLLDAIRSFRTEKSLSRTVLKSLWYVVPVVLALSVYALQLLSVPGWRGILMERFMLRGGFDGRDGNAFLPILMGLKLRFTESFGVTKCGWFRLVLIVATALYVRPKRADGTTGCGKVCFLKCLSSFGNAVCGRNGSIVALGFSAPILQILLFKQHSVVHEFSMQKLAWCVAMIPILVALLLWRRGLGPGKKDSNVKSPNYLRCFMPCFAALLIVTDIPFSSRAFYLAHQNAKDGPEDFRLAEILHGCASHDDVFFSFSREIRDMPPHELAVSRKRVHKISSAEELDTLFPNLPPHARKILVIDKKSADLTEGQLEEERALSAACEVFFEDDAFRMVVVGPPTEDGVEEGRL